MTQTKYLTLSDIAERIGVGVESIRVYHQRANKHRKEGAPRPGDLPEPDAVFGRSPVWREATIRRWEAARPGRGVRLRPTRVRRPQRA